MDGSFPRHLAFLGPLLKNRLIRVKATALMEERRLSIGAQVAFSLLVRIVDPIQFFAIFDDNDSTSSSNSSNASYSKQFFAATAASRRGRNNNNNNNTNSGQATGSPLAFCRESAFSMLQWAQHGKPPSPPREEIRTANNDNDNDNSDIIIILRRRMTNKNNNIIVVSKIIVNPDFTIVI